MSGLNEGKRTFWGVLWILVFSISFTVQAQFQFSTNNGTLTLTNYTGPGGAVSIPGNVDGMPVVAVGANAFLQNPLVTSVTVPFGVTNIENNVFTGCAGLTNIVLPSSVVQIGISAFSECTALRTISLPNAITKIANYTFNNCTALTNIIFPSALNEIGWNAFNGCSSLTRMTVPEGVILLGTRAFYNCGNLRRVILPKSLGFILQQAFADCPMLKEVFVRGNAPGYAPELFDASPLVAVYYFPGTTGWGSTYSSRPTVLWNPLMQPATGKVGGGTNEFKFLISGSTNLTLVVEATTNLSNAAWIPLQTNALATGPVWFNDIQSTNLPRRFYRVRTP